MIFFFLDRLGPGLTITLVTRTSLKAPRLLTNHPSERLLDIFVEFNFHSQIQGGISELVNILEITYIGCKQTSSYFFFRSDYLQRKLVWIMYFGLLTPY